LQTGRSAIPTTYFIKARGPVCCRVGTATDPHYKISNAGGDLTAVLLKTPLPDDFASLGNSEMLLRRKRMLVSAAALGILPYAESLGVTVKHEPLTRDQSNLQETPIALQFLPRNPVNKGMTFQDRLPNSRKILAPSHYVSAKAREILRPLRHCNNMGHNSGAYLI
jgi:hypothetical protein